MEPLWDIFNGEHPNSMENSNEEEPFEFVTRLDYFPIRPKDFSYYRFVGNEPIKFFGATSLSHVPSKIIPEELEGLVEVINESRRILDLAEDWDHEGSPDYSRKTWERATTFLLKHALWHWTQYKIVTDRPKILEGPDGSIDIHWKDSQAELLINIPEDATKPLVCYGDNRSGLILKGPLRDSDYKCGLWLLLKGGTSDFV
jgi:hypothetical protein